MHIIPDPGPNIVTLRWLSYLRNIELSTDQLDYVQRKKQLTGLRSQGNTLEGDSLGKLISLRPISTTP